VAFSEIEILMFFLPRVLVALLIGVLVGIEREYRGKLAGIKTNSLICVAAAVFTATSILMTSYGQSVDAANSDPTRIVAQIVSGIGFLGAGAIFKANNKIEGLTTAAVVWAVSALGIMVGCGIYLSSIIIAILFIVFLAVVSVLERRFFRVHGGAHGHPHHSSHPLNKAD
jgi:putative Mg2+ transporter-C (MgtC) family protein